MTIEPILTPIQIFYNKCYSSSSFSDNDNNNNIENQMLFIDDTSSEEKENKKTYLVYNENSEMIEEYNDFKSHLNKNSNMWISAKTIVSSSINKTKSQSFFWDYLDILFNNNNNNDNFNNIQKVIYSINDIVFEFDTTIAKYIVDNLKINSFKPSGYIFSSTDNNVWDFKIIVITSKNVYSANRYIDENTIGFY